MSDHSHSQHQHVEHGAKEAPAAEPVKTEPAAPVKDEALETSRSAYKAALEVFKSARQQVIDTRTTFKAENQRVKTERANAKTAKAA